MARRKRKGLENVGPNREKCLDCFNKMLIFVGFTWIVHSFTAIK
uniref:Uncharacterized protein n=1 Tax=Anguilla anguilla TaxID=7936 RepID=A0A0E9U8K5_ANGAN